MSVKGVLPVYGNSVVAQKGLRLYEAALFNAVLCIACREYFREK